MTDTSPEMSDPDLRHLADLFDLIPGPDDREFWNLVDGKGYPPQRDDDGYLLKKLTAGLLVLRKPNPARQEIAYLTHYAMTFFGGHHPALNQLIDNRFHISLPGAILGRFWVEDLMATCWRLFVRYSADGSWAIKWPDDRTSQDWRA